MSGSNSPPILTDWTSLMKSIFCVWVAKISFCIEQLSNFLEFLIEDYPEAVNILRQGTDSVGSLRTGNYFIMGTNWDSGDNIVSTIPEAQVGTAISFSPTYAKKIVPGGSVGGNSNDINIDIQNDWEVGQLVLLEGMSENVDGSHVVIKLVYKTCRLNVV